MNYGLDTLRVFALVLVTWQHVASVWGLYEETQWRGISPGQVGVAIFCAISGYLAFRARPQSVAQWFGKRLLKIFPAYWLATVAAFFLAAMASTKAISLGLFVSQMLGLGYFTHGWELVNVVSWFISLILLCYVLAAICWKSLYPEVALGVFALLALFFLLMKWEPAISRHVIAFCLGGCLALLRKFIWSWLLVATVLIVLGVMAYLQLFYGGIGLLAVLVATSSNLYHNSVLQFASKYSYEYFLVHGIFLVGVAHFVPQKLVALILALAGSVVAAFFLNHLSAFAVKRFRQVFDRAN